MKLNLLKDHGTTQHFRLCLGNVTSRKFVKAASFRASDILDKIAWHGGYHFTLMWKTVYSNTLIFTANACFLQQDLKQWLMVLQFNIRFLIQYKDIILPV